MFLIDEGVVEDLVVNGINFIYVKENGFVWVWGVRVVIEDVVW